MGFGGGPTYETSWLIDWLIDLIAMNDGFYYALWRISWLLLCTNLLSW